MRGKLVSVHPSIRKKVHNTVSNSISKILSASRNTVDGQLKRAVAMGQNDPKGLLQEGYTLGYGGVDMLRLQTTEHGLGIVALVPFLAGDSIIAARGQLLPSDLEQTEEQRRYTWEPTNPGEFVFSQWDIQQANIMRFVNSSQGSGRPHNAVLDWYINSKLPVLRALVDIVPGASGYMEIVVDYIVD